MPETHFDAWVARRYETLWPELFEPSLVESTVDFLAELAGDGPALELGVGTGRIAVPLHGRGVRVAGIELSTAMVEQLRARPGAADIPVPSETSPRGLAERFTLVYLLRNTITNLTTLDEQVACFHNAAAHLKPGGFFVIENYIPALQLLSPGETSRVITATPTHVGVEEYDLAAQIAVSRHFWTSTASSGRWRLRIATSGPPSSTSWPGSPAWFGASAGAIGSARRSPARADAHLRVAARHGGECRSMIPATTGPRRVTGMTAVLLPYRADGTSTGPRSKLTSLARPRPV